MRVKAIFLKSLFDNDKVLGDGMKITGLKARKPLRQDSGFFNAGFYFRKSFSVFDPKAAQLSLNAAMSICIKKPIIIVLREEIGEAHFSCPELRQSDLSYRVLVGAQISLPHHRFQSRGHVEALSRCRISGEQPTNRD